MKLSHIFQTFVLRYANLLAPRTKRGRTRILEDTIALDNIFKVLRTGMQWRELESCVHHTTILRRLHLWVSRGVFDAAYADALKVYKRQLEIMDDFTVIHILEEVAFMQQPLFYNGYQHEWKSYGLINI